jgi:hypothetical protein
MRKLVILIAIIFSFSKSDGQITKGNWMLSGNASISTQKNSSTASLQYSQTDILFSSGVGYFVYDKFSVGIRPSLIYGSNSISNSNTVFGVGPFLRYYFLKPENIINIFSETSYSYGMISGSSKSNTYSIFAGPVLYFNPNVGLEFSFGYMSTKVVEFSGTNNRFQLGIGFQFHLEKEK